MPQMDPSSFSPQAVWLVITFIVLFVVMWKWAVPNIAGALEARQRRINDNLDRAAEIKKEAEAALEAYEAAMADARARATTAVAEAAARLATEAAEREAALADELAARIADRVARIAKAIDDALGDVGAVAAEAAGAAMRRLIGEAADGAAIDAAVEAAMKARSGHV